MNTGLNRPARFRNFHIENVTCKTARKYGVYIVGVEGQHIKDVFLNNVTIENAVTPVEIKYADNVVFTNVHINGELQLAPSATATEATRR